MASGARIGRYRLDNLVSRGGMGEVWQAHDETLDRPVALKLLYEDLDENPVRERFLREARAVARLHHPNIVAVYDVGEYEGRPYLVMELVEGRTVADELVEHGALPIEMVREIGACTAAALHYAHLGGVVHRDIKPANLILTDGGGVKLVDFGLAFLMEEASSLTPDGTAMGTIAYVAPESARGDEIDERSDLYSLGCVLYELLCGRPPFVGQLPMVAYAHVQTPPEPLSARRSHVPAELETLVMSLLAKDPAHRPADAEVVRQHLLGLETVPLTTLSAATDRRRRPVALAFSGLVAASVVGLAGWWATSLDETSRTADNAEQRTSQVAPNPQPGQAKSPHEIAIDSTEQRAARVTPSADIESIGSSTGERTGEGTDDGGGDSGSGGGAGGAKDSVPDEAADAAKANARTPDQASAGRVDTGKPEPAEQNSTADPARRS